MVRTIAARLGAALAWDLADLPRHQIGAVAAWGGVPVSARLRRHDASARAG